MNKTRKINWKQAAALTALMVLAAVGFAGCKEDEPEPPTKPWEIATVEFVALGTFPGTIINFAPDAALPAGVTYTVTDNRPTPNTWTSGVNRFDGKINASVYDELEDTTVTFTQMFYLNDTKLTGASSERIVVVNVDTMANTRFMSVESNSGSVTLVHP